VLITLTEAQRLLGLTTRATLYRKVESGELASVVGANGKSLVESEGLAERWAAIVQVRPARPARAAAAPLDPAPAPLDPPPAPLDPPPAPPDPAPVSVAVAPAPKAEKRRSAAAADPAVPLEPPAGSAAADFDKNGVPVYNVQRAWAEYEKRLHEKEKRQITALERMEKEGILVYREDIEAAQAAVNAQIMSRAEALPKQIKLDIPHLTLEEMAAIEKRVMQIFEAVSEHDYAEVPE
jgi:hypothetical protein